MENETMQASPVITEDPTRLPDEHTAPNMAREALSHEPPKDLSAYKRNITEASKGIEMLLNRVLEIQAKGERFAWFNFVGHVDWIEISVSKNNQNFSTLDYKKTIYLPGSLKGSVNITDFENMVREALGALSKYV